MQCTLVMNVLFICRWKNWKRRWFVLNNRCLYYFQHTAENSPKGIIPLENVKVGNIIFLLSSKKYLK